MKKIGIFTICMAMLLATFLPHTKVKAANESITINDDSVNIREGPGLSYPLVAHAKKGNVYQVVSEKNGWCKIQLSNSEIGWVASWLIFKNGTSSSNSATANTDQIRIRTGPGTDFQTIGYLNKGQNVMILDQNENWTKVSSSFGDGWVYSDFLDQEYMAGSNSASLSSSSKSTSSGIINEDNVNVRSKPTTASTIIGNLPKGKKVNIISKQTNWMAIIFANKTAWISSQYVDVTSQESSSQKGIVGSVTVDRLRIHKSPSLNSSIVGTVNMGQSLTILEEKNNWDKVKVKSGGYGWIAGWYIDTSLSSSKSTPSSGQNVSNSKIVILQNGSNIRKSPNLQADVAMRANEGDTFPIIKVMGQWYQIKLKNNSIGYVAGWIVSVTGNAPQIEKPGIQNYLKNKTIILDPGHGGQDSGTTGLNGTNEKNLTLITAKLLYDKLKSVGANVILTRNNDSYVSLPSRVRVATYNQADAFISLHYDSDSDRNVQGTTGYYYHSNQKQLAEDLHDSLVSQTRLQDRGVRFGDFHVIRENSQKATLLELGYLSNPEEEFTMNTGLFQESAATGIYNGLAKFFMDNR